MSKNEGEYIMVGCSINIGVGRYQQLLLLLAESCTFSAVHAILGTWFRYRVHIHYVIYLVTFLIVISLCCDMKSGRSFSCIWSCSIWISFS